MRSRRCSAVSLLVIVSALQAVQLPAQTHQRQFQFEQFQAKVYQGPIKIPTGFHKDDKGEWHDENDKWVPAPEVGFAGEYYLPILSCGTGCRYHQLINLRTGKYIPEVTEFDAPEQRPVTKDGHPYLTMLYYKPDSRLLIAEYHLDFDNPNKAETCRQQYFLMTGDKLKPISKTFSFCTEDHEARQ